MSAATTLVGAAPTALAHDRDRMLPPPEDRVPVSITQAELSRLVWWGLVEQVRTFVVAPGPEVRLQMDAFNLVFGESRFAP